MKQKKDSSTALQVIRKASHLVQKEKEKLPSSSHRSAFLSECAQLLKDVEESLSQSTVTEISAGAEFGPKVEVHSRTIRLIVDLRTKVWMRLRRKYNLRCKSKTPGKKSEKN